MKPSLFALLFITLSVPAQAQRLPTTVLPDHYDLKIAVDLASASFTGEETIRARVARQTADVTLNAAEIAFDAVTISSGGRDQQATVKLSPRDEQVTFHVATPVGSGDAAIHISYKGVLNDELR